MAQINVSDDALGRAVSLISAACEHPLGKPTQGTTTSVQTSEGSATGLAACATALAVKSAAAADLLGRTPAEQAQVCDAAYAARASLLSNWSLSCGCLGCIRSLGAGQPAASAGTRHAPAPARPEAPPPGSRAPPGPQVSQWLTWCATELALLLDDKLAKVGGAGAQGAQVPCRR